MLANPSEGSAGCTNGRLKQLLAARRRGAKAKPLPTHPASVAPAKHQASGALGRLSEAFTRRAVAHLQSFSQQEHCMPLDQTECQELAGELAAAVMRRAVRLAGRQGGAHPDVAWHFKARSLALLAEMARGQNGGRLVERLALQTITPAQAAEALPDELWPGGPYAMAMEACDSHARRTESAASEVDAVATAFTCGKCRGSNVTYTTAQTRSADEPATAFFFCVTCSNRWRQ